MCRQGEDRPLVSSTALKFLVLPSAFCLLLSGAFAPWVRAGEDSGQEHGGATAASTNVPAAMPHPGTPEVVAEPSVEQIGQTIREYIAQIEEDEGAFTIEDEVTGKTRTLTLDRVHDQVGKADDLYYSCTDMKDKDSGETLDLDFDVESYDGELEVVDTRIHKVNGQPRCTYDGKDNRIPVTP